MGSEKRRFDVHRELVCSKFKFFAKAFLGDFREAATKIIELPEQHVETFQYFVHWLYTNKLSGYFRPKGEPSIRELSAVVEASKKTMDRKDLHKLEEQRRKLYCKMNKDAPILKLVSLYVLADALQVHGLTDHIMTFLIKVYGDDENTFWDPSNGPVTESNKPVTESNCTLVMSEAYDRLESLLDPDHICGLIADLHARNVVKPQRILHVDDLNDLNAFLSVSTTLPHFYTYTGTFVLTSTNPLALYPRHLRSGRNTLSSYFRLRVLIPLICVSLNWLCFECRRLPPASTFASFALRFCCASIEFS